MGNAFEAMAAQENNPQSQPVTQTPSVEIPKPVTLPTDPDAIASGVASVGGTNYPVHGVTQDDLDKAVVRTGEGGNAFEQMSQQDEQQEIAAGKEVEKKAKAEKPTRVGQMPHAGEVWKGVSEPLIPRGHVSQALADYATSSPSRFDEKHPVIAGELKGGAGAIADTMEFARSMTSPLMIATLEAGEIAKAGGVLGKLAKASGLLTGFGFGAQGGVNAYEGVHKMGTDGVTPENTSETLNGLSQVVMGAAGGLHETKLGKTNLTPGINRPSVEQTPTTVAGVTVPRARVVEPEQNLPTKVASSLTTHGRTEANLRALDAEAAKINEGTYPAAQRAVVSTLSQVATDKIAAHDAIAEGKQAPEEITGTQTPGQHMTPDEIWPDMQDSANKTWDKARDESSRELAAWKQQRAIAEASHQAGIDHYNNLAEAHNADPANADNLIEPLVFKPEDVDAPEKPKGYDDLKAELDAAKDRTGRLNPTDVREKARTIEVPKAEKALDQWFKEHEDAVSPTEYQSAKQLWADSERFKEIATQLRGKIAKGNLNGNDIRGLEAVVDGKAIRRRGAAGVGEFNRVMGPEAVDNLKNVAKYFDPLEKSDPRASSIISWGGYIARHALSTVLAPALGGLSYLGVEGGNLLLETFMNHVMFDPEFGSTFSKIADATKTAMETGTQVPLALAGKFRDMLLSIAAKYKTSRLGGEEGVVGAGVKRANVGPRAAVKETPQTVSGVADEYNQAQGRPALDQTKHEPDDRRAQIADAFDAMKHDPKDPEVKASYQALIDETKAQRKFLESKGYKFDKSETDPYTSYEQMRDDVRNNKHLSVWTGGNELPTDHPLGKIDKETGWRNNDLVRGVHDVMGHVAGDNDFSEKGEENAYKLHKQAFSEAARPALTTETKGQTSWYWNNKGVREGGQPGFPDQKAGILPEHIYTDDPVKGIVSATNTNGGATYNPTKGDLSGTDAYAVPMHPDLSRTIEGTTITPERVKSYLSIPGVKEALVNDPELSVGTWVNDGKVYFDLSKAIPDRDEAIRLGNENNQKAITYLKNFEEIPLGNKGTGTALAELASKEIATRIPTTKNADLTNNPDIARGLDAINEADKNRPTRVVASSGNVKLGVKQTIANALAGYEGSGLKFTPEELADPDKVLEKTIEHYKGNLKMLHDAIPEAIRQISRHWYESAHELSKKWSDQYGLKHEQVAGVIAALSPKNPWDNNAGVAERLIKTWKEGQGHAWSKKMDSRLSEIANADSSTPSFKSALEAIRGKTFKQLSKLTTDPAELRGYQGLWLRMVDEAHGSNEVPLYSPDGVVRGSVTRTWGMPDPVAKAIDILENGDIQHLHEVMGDGNKIRNFYNNIINPNSERGHVTIDTHAVGAAHLKPFSQDDEEVKNNFGGNQKGRPGAGSEGQSGVKGTYHVYEEAYRRAANELGLLPRELQSITWEGIRSLVSDADKKDPVFRQDIDDIWRDHEEGKISLDDARDKIVERAGGFKKPDWATDEMWDNSDTGFNPEELQNQMTHVGTDEHSMQIDVNPPAITPEIMKWKGQEQPMLTRKPNGRLDYSRLGDIADYANANVSHEDIVKAAAHEIAHAFVQHHLTGETSDMEIKLGHEAMRKGQKVGSNKNAKSSVNGISGGYVSPGPVWKDSINNAPTPEARRQNATKYVTNLMAGRAIEEMLGEKYSAVTLHAKADTLMAKNVLKVVGIPSYMHDALLSHATEDAKKILKANFDTVKHITAQSVNHYGGDAIDSGTFHKYRNGGVYEKQ